MAGVAVERGPEGGGTGDGSRYTGRHADLGRWGTKTSTAKLLGSLWGLDRLAVRRLGLSCDRSDGTVEVAEVDGKAQGVSGNHAFLKMLESKISFVPEQARPIKGHVHPRGLDIV